MNNMCHIALLPKEVLKQIPTSYRQWRLLQLTCRRLYNSMGNYHAYHNMRLFSRGGNVAVSYSLFMHELIDTAHKAPTLSHQMSIVAIDRTSYKCTTLFKWNTLSLVFVCCGGHFISRSSYSIDRIVIGNDVYSVSDIPQVDRNRIFTWIYDELPALFSTIKVPKKASLGDLIAI
jgi:hypothetical protein